MVHRLPLKATCLYPMLRYIASGVYVTKASVCRGKHEASRAIGMVMWKEMVPKQVRYILYMGNTEKECWGILVFSRD